MSKVIFYIQEFYKVHEKVLELDGMQSLQVSVIFEYCFISKY
jgi:hypothetical protein